jgi:hypothetical protein
LEFAIPLLDERRDAIRPEALASALTTGTKALVCSRPVHPRQYERFNASLYAQLGSGASVEQGVQKAREALFSDKRIEFAGFGWFSLVTGPVTRVRLVEAAAATEGGRESSDVLPSADRPTQDVEEGHRDQFTVS